MSNKTRKKQLKQVQNQAQDGRSMVEMLGVLAIIGVISIGGISGYRMAMNRYQANQIANEINLMRTDAKMKVAQGAEELLLGEPYDGKDGHLNFNANYGVAVKFEEIGTDTPGETETGYSFALSGIPAGVCKPLATLLDGMDDTAALEINGKDYETAENLCDNEENEVVVAFSTKDIGGETKCNPDKCEGKCTEAGECEPCPEEMPWNGSACACLSGKHWNGNECVSCSGGKVWDGSDCSCPAGAEKSGEDGEECACSNPAKPHWNGTECTECPNGSTWDSTTGECKCEGNKVWKESVSGEDKCVEIVGECESNADCGPGEYCYMYYGNGCGDDKEFNTSKFGGYSSYVSECRNARKDAVIGAKTGFALGWPEGTKSNSKYMNWWSAGRFCEALGMSRPTRASIGCDDVPRGGYCQSETRQNMYDDFKDKTSYYVWLEDEGNSCSAYLVGLPSGYVNHLGRNNGSGQYALCE